MAFNFGVDKHRFVSGPVPSIEEFFDAYMEFENIDRETSLFLKKGDQLEDALENLVIIGRALKHHASAEGLAVIKDIVRGELGQTVSLESVKETTSRVLAEVKEFFKKIGALISEYFTRFLGMVLHAEKIINTKIDEVEKLPSGTELKWSYTGLELKGGAGSLDQLVLLITMALGGKVGKDITATKKTLKHALNVKNCNVNGKDETLAVLKHAKDMIELGKTLKESIVKHYKDAEKTVNESNDSTSPEVLKNSRRAASAALSVARRYCGIFSRTVASVAIHAKTKPEEAQASN